MRVLTDRLTSLSSRLLGTAEAAHRQQLRGSLPEFLARWSVHLLFKQTLRRYADMENGRRWQRSVQITRHGASHNPAESPDGTAVFYHALRDPGEIWRIPVEGGQASKIAGPTQRFPVGFTVTPEGVYYGAPPHDGDRRFIRFVSFSTGKNIPVAIAARPFHSGMSVSPDSRYILFDQYDESGSDLMLVQNFQLR